MKLLCLFSLPQLGFRVQAFFITTTPKMQRHRSKFTHPLWSPQNDWTDQSSTNNKVWVTWKSPASGEFVADKIRELNDRAMIKDLRREFVKQQCLQNIDRADVKVREKINGQVLEEDAFLKQYFVPPEGRGEGPGQSEDTALFLTLPNEVSLFLRCRKSPEGTWDTGRCLLCSQIATRSASAAAAAAGTGRW